MLKRRPPKHEVDIGTFFSTESMRSNPSNHCLPVLEVLNTPDPENPQIIVMPLVQGFREPSFVTIGETVDFIRQVFEVSLVRCLLSFSSKFSLGIEIYAFIPRFSSVGPPLPYET